MVLCGMALFDLYMADPAAGPPGIAPACIQVLELHHIYVNPHLQEMLARIQENCARKSETYSKRLGPFNQILSCGVVTVSATDILPTRTVRSTGGLVLISTKIIALLVLPMISR